MNEEKGRNRFIFRQYQFASMQTFWFLCILRDTRRFFSVLSPASTRFSVHFPEFFVDFSSGPLTFPTWPSPRSRHKRKWMKTTRKVNNLTRKPMINGARPRFLFVDSMKDDTVMFRFFLICFSYISGLYYVDFTIGKSLVWVDELRLIRSLCFVCMENY